MKAMVYYAGGLTLAVAALIAVSTKPSPVPDKGVIVVDAPAAAGSVVLSAPSPASATGSAPVVAPSPFPERALPQETASSADETALTELFQSQTRDAPWADGAEGVIRSRLGGAGTVDCLAFMCRVRVVLPNTSDGRTPDEDAMRVTAGWPEALSYNRFTAMISDDPRGKALTFYVTRAAPPQEEETY